MSSAQYLKSFSKLVLFRASLFTSGFGRAGGRLPNLEHSLKEWIFASRVNNDITLLSLEAKITGGYITIKSAMNDTELSRNTVKRVIRDALALQIIEQNDDIYFRATEQFYNSFQTAFASEMSSMNPQSAASLAETFRGIARKRVDMDLETAEHQMVRLAILSRAGSVKADRNRLTPRATGASLDISSWVILTKFNRDMLILIMSAQISDKSVSINFLTHALFVSRNSVKTSLRLGVSNGFLIRDGNGYRASLPACSAYLNWHYEVFKQYDDKLLSAFAITHEAIALKDAL
jgi:hypothetical protein